MGGSLKWLKSFGGSDMDCFSSVIETSDGGFAASGFSMSKDRMLSETRGKENF